MTSYIKKLPPVFQTTTETKFFDATFDQVFSKKDSDLLQGYIGQRIPGIYNPVNDFYLPEPTKDRTWWQLEATTFAKNKDTTKTNIFFYDDLLNRINYYGGNTLNQDRLFESEFYSWAPPIDVDMFTNYENYYWIDAGLTTINISGVTSADIIGKSSYTTPATAVPSGLALTSGMRILLSDDPAPEQLTVENIGGCDGIRLVPQFPDFLPGTILEFLPWDGSLVLANGRLIQNTNWDTLTWDVEVQPGNADYITIERGSVDRNSWSRTNKWFHIDAINATINATGSAFPTAATRALRPIIQFVADLKLYKTGTQFREDIDYGFRDNQYGQPIRFLQYQGQTIETVNSELFTDFKGGELICFFNDNTPFDFWDTGAWNNNLLGDFDNWDEGVGIINKFIFQVIINSDNTVDFEPYTSWSTPIIEGDIVLVAEDGPYDSAQRGQTWYYSNDIWQEAFNDKISTNQPPIFQLYDHNGIELDNELTYPLSTFSGSKIFSYKINTTPGAYTDPVLKFPIVYTSLGQASDIIFQNNLITDRYIYSTNELNIDGYYYYKIDGNNILYNNWNLYTPDQCGDIIPPPPANLLQISKQRVIDRYVVGYGSKYQYELSVMPYGYVFGAGPIQLSADISVSVNGTKLSNKVGGFIFEEINSSIYVNIDIYVAALLTSVQSKSPVVEIQTYTHNALLPSSQGYFDIPQQLKANPSQLEISEISGSDLAQQFSSIIANQINETGNPYGDNNYRDTLKNRSLGSYILQNIAPLLKTMLVSSSDDIDIIKGIRFSSTEYTKFKNRYLSTALQLINQEFSPPQYHNNTVIISAWVDEILKRVNISSESSNAFAYSYMIANGSPNATETQIVPPSGNITLSTYIDLNNLKNAIYIYDTSGQEKLLVIGKDYEIVSSNLSIDIHFNLTSIPAGSNISVLLYTNPVPAYIPSTPSKVGAYTTYLPRIELDTSYAIPAWVIIGHDGSKTIAFGNYDQLTGIFTDYRDSLLLELEKRIYNLIQYRFRHQYAIPLRIESVKAGYFRKTRYSTQEYLDITESYLNKWAAANRANYRINDWYTTSVNPLLDTLELWKLYNYSSAVRATTLQPLNLPGNWKGIFQYYYDTIYPNTCPWEMLGFSEQPEWWVSQYGLSVTNSLGEQAWPNTPLYALMWGDLENGVIRQGPSAVYNPVSLLPQPQLMWARPGLSAIIPVNGTGDIISVINIFNVNFSGNIYEPFDHFDDDWKYGDGSPVEQAWMSTSGYAFSVQEFLYLMKPGPFGELLWDTIGTETSPGTLIIPGIENPVQSDTNYQYVQNNINASSDSFYSWMRPKNKDQTVHGESLNGDIYLGFGYQRWISDRLLYLGKDITTSFGQLIRTLDVNLANKLAGFTNKDTTNIYIESVSPGVTNTSLSVPSNNFDVILHKGQPIKTYSYSGVIIRALENGMFAVYGYDLLHSEFTILERSDAQLIDVTIGGTPAEFQQYSKGATYQAGDIVRYNGVYYASLAVQTVNKFDITGWQKLRALPIIGGISVTYRPASLETTIRVPYGSILSSAQEVFDLLISWGAYLESQGWQFDDVNQDTNIISDWLYSAKQFLFWLNTNWAPNASIQLSPSANVAKLIVSAGYPDNVETISNGIYSILDKFGVAIPTKNTATERAGQQITIIPEQQTSGIYFLQVTASEMEHVLIFDNSTSFGDTIYDPLLQVRQDRLKFIGFRSNGWYGKMEASGYIIIDNQMVPNFDTIVSAMRYYYDPDVIIDNPSLEDLGRHLIGYESKSYLDNLQVSNDIQYLFYQGAIRQKGTIQTFDKLFRSTKVRGNENIEVFEEWALKLGNFGNTVEQVSTEIVLIPEQTSRADIVARLNFIPSKIGFVKQINILNAETSYTSVPMLSISSPDADPFDTTLTAPLRQAKAYVVLDSNGIISRVDITDQGYGYLTAPSVEIIYPGQHNKDRLYVVWQGEITQDIARDNIIEIDIDDTSLWVYRPQDPAHSMEFPTTANIEYAIPNAGYANFNDVKWTAFNNTILTSLWGSTQLNPVENDTIWVADTFTYDWGIYKMIPSTGYFDIVKGDNNNLLLRTLKSNLITPQLSLTGNTTDFGNNISLQVIEATATAIVSEPSAVAEAQAIIPITAKAVVTGINTNGGITGISITSYGDWYDFAPTITIDPPGVQNGASGTSVLSAGKVTGINLISGGSGYITAPSVIISSPTLEGCTATANLSGGSITSLHIDKPGFGYIVPPIVSIGVGVIRYATASATLLNNSVSTISVTAAGSGYSIAPTVTVSDLTRVNATAFCTVNLSGQISLVSLSDAGKGYATPPSINILGGGGTGAIISATVANGQISSITISNGGSGYQSAPTLIISVPNGEQATASASIANGIVTNISISDAGSGYTNVPDVTIDSPSIVVATATATIAGGVITGFTITNPGGGYTSTPTVTIATPPGSTASATATISNGVVTSISMINVGGGYITPPTVSFGSESITAKPASASLTMSGGRVNSITILNPGAGYITTPNITIQSPSGANTVRGIDIISGGVSYVSPVTASLSGGDGTGAVLGDVTIVDGQITAIEVINAGSGYTIANVDIPAPTGISGGLITSINVDKTGSGYSSAPTITISDPNPLASGASATAKISGGIVTEIDVITSGTGYTNPVVTLTPPIAINPVTNYVLGFSYAQADNMYNYYNLLSPSGMLLTETEVPDYLNFTKLMLFKSMRFETTPAIVPSYISEGDKIWIDNGKIWNTLTNTWVTDSQQLWNVSTYSLPSSPSIAPFTLFRQQEKLIDTKLFESVRIYGETGEIILLPVYDPFKKILPALVTQNIGYITLMDPTNYNVTGTLRQYSPNITFGELQVGKLWWDLSTAKYTYYEQPIALDNSESPTDNLVYRRDLWGQLFPGSTIDIYEWTKSSVPPADYTGSGTPKYSDSYVQIVTSNKFTNITEINYYFWVKNSTTKPNIENRTLTSLDVARLLSNPKSQQYAFFAPIQQTNINSSYMFYNVQNILAQKGNNVQLEYRLADRNDQKHTQWSFFREGDTGSVVTTQFWDKMVDSLCGYTKLLSVTDEWDGIIIASALPWDIYGWDVAAWDDATTTSIASYGAVLAVPDPQLSEEEKYGISYRPRQGMFVDVYYARKIFVQSANALLQYIPIRDNNPSWNSNVSSNTYWYYTTWFEVGFENVTPSVIYPTLTLAQNAVTAEQLATGTIIEVTNGTPDGRFVLYNVQQINPAIPVQSLQLIGIESSAIQLANSLYTTQNVYELSVELRQILDALRTEIFINDHQVDQNELYFSLLNYVVSEQKNPNWLFKTSYIYIKENDIQLSQDTLYVPDQIDNIMSYIIDTKPYHTQIRDYTSTYLLSDLAQGTAIDNYDFNIILQYGPNFAGDMYGPDYQSLDAMPGWDLHQGPVTGPWDTTGWDIIPSMTDVIDQVVSELETTDTITITIPATSYDTGKKGYSNLYPYTFNFNGINLNNPQTFITPENIVGMQVGDHTLVYGQDYYVESNNDTTYTVYFYNNPSDTITALVWFNGGRLLTAAKSSYNNETAQGSGTDNLVINVDTRLPVNDISGVPDLAPATCSPYVGWGNSWDAIGDPVISQILVDNGGIIEVPWDTPLTIKILPNTISFKESIESNSVPKFYRNADVWAGVLVVDLPAPNLETENLDTIIITTLSDILPEPDGGAEAIWIDGERIQYKKKESVSPNMWKLSLIERGTLGTAPAAHYTMVPSIISDISGTTLAYQEISSITISGTTATVTSALPHGLITGDFVALYNSVPENYNSLKAEITVVDSSTFTYEIIDVPSVNSTYPGTFVALNVPNKVWIERSDSMPVNSNINIWNAINLDIDGLIWDESPWELYPWDISGIAPYIGGLWYSQTQEAVFLKQEQGISIP